MDRPAKYQPDAEAGASREAASPKAPTPMISQYVEIKAANPDCLLFYRMGDFYELFFEDAATASRALGIMLTKRGKHLGEDIPMCGVPVERANDYLQKLIALGHKVAVCEQLEDPAEARKRGPKAVVRRDVVRLVTPGTITEDALLDPGRSNAFAALARLRAKDGAWSFGFASVDISTGAFKVGERSEAELASALGRLEPREIVVPEGLLREPQLRSLLEGVPAPISPVGREAPEGASAERRLMEFFRVSTLEGFGTLSPAEIAAAALAVHYVERTQRGERPALAAPTSLRESPTLEIDAATRANLEIAQTLSGSREGSLVGAIDLTVTPAGKRGFAERLGAPSTEPSEIGARLDAVAFFLDAASARQGLRERLSRAPDLVRALARLSLQRGGPRDLAGIAAGLGVARDIAAFLTRAEATFPPPEHVTRELVALAAADAALERRLEESLVSEPPADRRAGGFIAKGVDAELDEARSLRDESRRVIAGVQAKYAETAGVRQLKVKHNNFLGFFVEVPQAQGERLLKPPLDQLFTHRQTMADAMRFTTQELMELDRKIAQASERALAREEALFVAMSEAILAQTAEIRRIAQGFAALDVIAALAEIAARRDWVRPAVELLARLRDRGRARSRRRGRAESARAGLRRQTTARSRAESIAVLVTGPNMAGKSTFLRQNALIARARPGGGLCAGREAHIGVVDRLFSRVGAADDLARGRSTFMVEMVETAAILNQAGARSLVILDEIGRGTATFDGLSIAWAAIEHLHEVIRCRALFATHFHELTRLSKRLPSPSSTSQ